MGWYFYFNTFEGVLWLLVAVMIAVRTPRSSTQQVVAVLLAVTAFFQFGLTDFVEAHFESRVPLWLYFWKITCGACIFASRYIWLGWHRFRWFDRETLFALFCLIAVIGIMIYQYSQ